MLRRGAMYATLDVTVGGSGATALWLLGGVVLAVTLVQSIRRAMSAPPPSLSGTQVATAAGWLIVAALIVYAATQLR